jgi:Kef-type K+ transport system membrane component KefB
MITPFFFIKGGVSVSLADVAQNWLLLVILFGVKSVAKFVGVWPLARRYAGDRCGVSDTADEQRPHLRNHFVAVWSAVRHAYSVAGAATSARGHTVPRTNTRC